jgi:hypothetical protein
MTSLLEIAKTAPRNYSRQFWLGKLDERASELRQPGLTHQQDYSRMLDNDSVGKAFYQASKIAEFEHPDEYQVIAKAQSDAIGTSLTATERLSLRCIELKKSMPLADETEIIEEVLRKNPEMADLMRAENGLPVVKGQPSGYASDHLIRAAEGLVRRKVAPDQDSAMRRVIATHPKTHAQALAEFDDDGMAVGKRGVRVNVSKAANDARERLQAIIERLVASGMDGRSAEYRAKQANPELWDMACGEPNDSEDLSVDADNGQLLTRDPPPKNRSVATGLRVKPYNLIGKAHGRDGRVTFQKA